MKLCKTLSLGMATLALGSSAFAQAPMMDAPAPMAAPMTAPAMSATTPMPVSGQVVRYYVDRSGFVSAMDVQTADGVRMVRFSPSMAQNLTAMYPVGSTASVYVTSSMMGGMTNYYLAGTGPSMPNPAAMMMPMTVTDLDILKAEPFIMLGAKSGSHMGTLSGYVSDPMTMEVLAIIISKDDQKTLVRVPRENRLKGSTMADSRIVPLVKGADVIVSGYEEAPRYGVVSPYAKRVVATGISVNTMTLGPLGFGKVKSGAKDTLLGFNLNLGGFLGGSSPDDVKATEMGVTTYEVAAPAPAPEPMPAPMQ